MSRFFIACPVFVLFTLIGATRCISARLSQSNLPLSAEQLLRKLAPLAAYPCSSDDNAEDSTRLETLLFESAANMAVQALNGPDANRSPSERVAVALEKLARLSAKVNGSWSTENRFHFQLLDISPVLVVKLKFRGQARFFVFGVPAEAEDQKPNQLWGMVGSDDIDPAGNAWSTVDLYSLHRSSSENARFLARFEVGGCAGSMGLEYDAREWDPSDFGDLRQIIKQTGALGMDDKVPGFPWVGEFKTGGALVTLPFCWFSPIDTWDNPSLCAVDTYDLSGNDVTFRTRTYNRPDLLPIAKALQYAENRNYRAVLGYCASAEVARSIVDSVPPFVFASDLKVASAGNGKERVILGYPYSYRFDVEDRAGTWVIVAFKME